MFFCFVPFEWGEDQSHKPKLQNYLEFWESFSIWDSTMEPIKFLLDFLCCRFSTSFFFPSLSLQTSWPWVGTPPSPWLEITYYRWGHSFLQNKSDFFCLLFTQHNWIPSEQTIVQTKLCFLCRGRFTREHWRPISARTILTRSTTTSRSDRADVLLVLLITNKSQHDYISFFCAVMPY